MLLTKSKLVFFTKFSDDSKDRETVSSLLEDSHQLDWLPSKTKNGGCWVELEQGLVGVSPQLELLLALK